MSSLPSGVRLVALLNEHLGDIMSRERTNTASIHLYCTGPYWVAFECSAYQLRRAFQDSEVTPNALVRLPVSCGDGFRDGSFAPCVCPQAHLAKRQIRISKQLTVPGFSLI